MKSSFVVVVALSATFLLTPGCRTSGDLRSGENPSYKHLKSKAEPDEVRKELLEWKRRIESFLDRALERNSDDVEQVRLIKEKRERSVGEIERFLSQLESGGEVYWFEAGSSGGYAIVRGGKIITSLGTVIYD